GNASGDAVEQRQLARGSTMSPRTLSRVGRKKPVGDGARATRVATARRKSTIDGGNRPPTVDLSGTDRSAYRSAAGPCSSISSKRQVLLTSILYNSASFAMLPCHGNLMQGLTYRSVPVYRVHLGTGTILVPGDMHSAARDPRVLATRERRRRASDDGARARTARER
ncbi:hypothetical protein BHE74_00053140, partial [Ensete ventricosum]